VRSIERKGDMVVPRRVIGLYLASAAADRQTG